VKKTTFSLALLFCALPLIAGPGTTGYELFRVDGFARSASLAGSVVARGGDLSSLRTNPAGLALIGRKTALAGFTKHVLDINQGTLAYATPFRSKAVLALSLDYLNYGSFDRADENGQVLGEFGASDFQITAGAAQKMTDVLRLGGSLKYQYRDIDGISASAVAIDAGAQYETAFNNWSVGGAVKNFGAATSSFLSEKDDLPTSYELGFAAPLEHLPVFFSVTGAYTSAEGIEGRGGLEITFTPHVLARLGYSTVGIDQRTGLSSDALAGFSGGLGLKWNRLALDYSVTSHGEIGLLNRFTLTSTL
jgi:hypothetical protein